ncbi:MAG: RHS repeat-associated core domain-containing protein [Paucimonas sp.]|jgi:RHS repeat-associated protein|nr:RHS repeat-associated core domain-containing protein [Paucimonas sp.]
MDTPDDVVQQQRSPAGRQGFNGELPDPVTGHYLLGNGYRAYSSVLMIFLQPDSWSPFGAGGLNAYQYCLGDPLNHRDPTGHAAQGSGDSTDASPWLWISIALGVAAVGAGVGIHGLKKRWTASYISQQPSSPPPSPPPPRTPTPIPVSATVENPSRPLANPVLPPAQLTATSSRRPGRQVQRQGARARRVVDPNTQPFYELSEAVKRLDGASFSSLAVQNGYGSAAAKALDIHLPYRDVLRNRLGKNRFGANDFYNLRDYVDKVPASERNPKLIPFLDAAAGAMSKVRSGGLMHHKPHRRGPRS